MTLIGYALAFYFLSLTLKTMPVGIVYAVWSGAGVVLIAAIGWIWYRQPIDAPGLIGIGLILAGVLDGKPVFQIGRPLMAMPNLLVNIDVDDLAKAERFYTEAFGLRPSRRFGADGVELLGLEAPIYLLRKPAGSQPIASADQKRKYARHWTPVHFDIVVKTSSRRWIGRLRPAPRRRRRCEPVPGESSRSWLIRSATAFA